MIGQCASGGEAISPVELLDASGFYGETAISMEIHISRDGERRGPFTLEEINQRLAAGTLYPTDQAWYEGSPGWKPLSSIAGVILPGGASSTAMPLSTAAFVSVSPPRFGGFWIRVVACLVDTIILLVPTLFLGFIFPATDGSGRMSAVSSSISIAMVLVYFPMLWSSRLQASVGQWMCGLRVVRASDGNKLGVIHALARLLARALSSALFGIGYLMVAFTERKQGLHDIIVGTYVVRDS